MFLPLPAAPHLVRPLHQAPGGLPPSLLSPGLGPPRHLLPGGGRLPPQPHPPARHGLVHLLHVHHHHQRHCRLHVWLLLRLDTSDSAEPQEDCGGLPRRGPGHRPAGPALRQLPAAVQPAHLPSQPVLSPALQLHHLLPGTRLPLCVPLPGHQHIRQVGQQI